MGRELQKKKRRSMRQPVRPNKPAKKVLNPRGNSIIAKNWDKKETLAQNYRRLGLVARLKAPTGGTEKKLGETVSHAALARAADPFAIVSVEKAVVAETQVERDAEGRIVRVLGRDNPLDDPLRALDSDSELDDDDQDEEKEEEGRAREDDSNEKTGGGRKVDGAPRFEEWGGIADDHDAGVSDVVRSLLDQARNPAPRRSRHLSEREREWLDALTARHGDDVAAMARDRKLNPMQQTAADIARRLRKLRQS